MEKLKAKKAIQKGNMEVARIHAENAIRQKNQSVNYLRMSARVDAVASRVQSALTTRNVREREIETFRPTIISIPTASRFAYFNVLCAWVV